MNMRSPRSGQRRQAGYTYLMLLLAVVIIGVALASVATFWSTESKRSKEAELLFIGNEFKRAIDAYHAMNPTVGDGFPATLEMLVLDPNVPVVRRHLRRVYTDPMTGKAEWGLVRSRAGGIVGIYSLSEAEPIKTADLPKFVTVILDGRGYSRWRFAAATPIAAPPGSKAAETVNPLPMPAAPAVDVPSSLIAASPAQRDGTPPRRPDRCQSITANDVQICTALERRYGKVSSGPCFESAQLRQGGCQAGDTVLPPLVTNIR